jgi:hypothetical protein
MKEIICFLLFVLPFCLFAQPNKCENNLYAGGDCSKIMDGVHSMYEYVVKQLGVDGLYVSDRRLLERIPLWLNNGSRLLFRDSIGHDVEISIQREQVDGSEFFDQKAGDEKYSRIQIKHKRPYGIMSEDKEADCISYIKVNSKCTPVAAFSDILNPNMLFTLCPVKPIEAYHSEDKKYIYVYIFGRTRDDICEDLACSFAYSYMAKLIFSEEGDYMGRIVEHGEILNYFGFYNCCDFIGF